MTLERTVIFAIWILGLPAILMIPRSKRDIFILGYMVCQAFTWANAALTTELGMITYPVREFPKATDMGFTTEFFLYPVMCGFYVIYEPIRSWFVRGFNLLAWSAGMAFVQYEITRYTRLLRYEHYSWAAAWFDFTVVFMLTNLIVRWFYHDPVMVQGARGER